MKQNFRARTEHQVLNTPGNLKHLKSTWCWVERWFAELQRRCLDRGVFCSLDELTTALEHWIKFWNANALTIPLATLLGLADRPGEIPGLGPVDPWLARDLAAAAARNPRTTWCVTVTDEQGHAVGHGCVRPKPRNQASRRDKPDKPDPPGGPDPPRDTPGPGFSFTASDRHDPPGGYGTWKLRTGTAGRPDLLVALDPVTTENCDHRFQAKGHDPGVKLRHLAQVRHATCTNPICRRPASNCDFEHNIPYEAGGRTCLCNGGPKCRRDHRFKQDPRWKVDQLPDGTFRWTGPSGRQAITEPTRYPI